MVMTSLKNQAELLQNPLDFSIDFSQGWGLFRSYRELFADFNFGTYLWTSFYVSVITELLTLAKVEPRAVRQVELTAVILLLVASNRGVAVLPDWVVREVRYNSDYVTRPITKGGMTISTRFIHMCAWYSYVYAIAP